MDTIRFVKIIETDPFHRRPIESAEIIINGMSLCEIVGAYEKEEFGLISDYVSVPAYDLYKEITNPDLRYDSPEITLLICGGCMDYGCWPIIATMEETDVTVVWKDFCNPHKYPGFGQYSFYKETFWKEVERLKVFFEAKDLSMSNISEVENFPGNTWAEKVGNYWASDKQKYRRNKIQGALIGGAAGDALGYAVKSLDLRRIRRKYGDDGITSYELQANGKAIVSDETQMTLFTANGLLNMQTEAYKRSFAPQPATYVACAYDDWYATQAGIKKVREMEAKPVQYTWLYNIRELHKQRAPDMTCLSALQKAHDSKHYDNSDNDNKGSGGVMRAAPIGLLNGFSDSPERVIEAAHSITTITHGHPLGWLPSCILAELMRHIVYDNLEPSYSLKDAILSSIKEVEKLYRESPYWMDLVALLNRALDFAGNNKSDEMNIKALGEGCDAKEILAIAVYCAVRYSDNFSDCIIAAVNHNGDSDSAGAIAGNILGAWLGIDKIHEKWLNTLELKEVILEIADDLADGCVMKRNIEYEDGYWNDKYTFCYYKSQKYEKEFLRKS